jgi:CopG-like RHH_1 or ribbon-helix-helix domain, RHH_5
LSETPDEVWERDDCVHRTVVLPTALAERLAAEAERRGLSVSDLLVEYADDGLRRGDAGADQ